MGSDRRDRCCRRGRGDAADAAVGGVAAGVGARDRGLCLRLSLGAREIWMTWHREFTFYDKKLHSALYAGNMETMTRENWTDGLDALNEKVGEGFAEADKRFDKLEDRVEALQKEMNLRF